MTQGTCNLNPLIRMILKTLQSAQQWGLGPATNAFSVAGKDQTSFWLAMDSLFSEVSKRKNQAFAGASYKSEDSVGG